MSYPPHLDDSHVTGLFRPDLRLLVGCGLMLRISCACRDSICQFCVQSIGIHYALSDLFNPWARGTLQKLVLSVLEKSLRLRRRDFADGDLTILSISPALSGYL